MTEIFPLSLWSTTPQPSKIWTHHHGYALPVYQTTYSTRVICQNSRWSFRKRSVSGHHIITYGAPVNIVSTTTTWLQPRHFNPVSPIDCYYISFVARISIQYCHQTYIILYDIRGCFGLSWYLSIIMQQSNRWCVLGWRVQNIQQYTREIYQI